MSAALQIAEFQKALFVVPCVKTSVPQLIGFYGESGGGKTVTALICLVGMVGPRAKIGIVDTENRRAGMAADLVKRMARDLYKAEPETVVVNLEPPFHPLKYVAALEVLRVAECQAFMVDSMTHAWNGNGGYLDLKEEALDRMVKNLRPDEPGYWKRRESCAMAAAAQVKPHTHAKLVDAILHLKAPTVLCFRSKEKTTIKRQEGKTVIETDPYGTPIQEEGMIYEMLVSGEVSAREGIGGYCSFRGVGRKTTHPDILPLLPKEGEQFGFGHGKALADWCAEPVRTPASPPTVAPAAAPPAPRSAPPASQAPAPPSSQAPPPQSPTAPAQPPSPTPVVTEQVKRLRKELWRLTADYRPKEEKNWTTTREWLLEHQFLAEPGVLANLTEQELEQIIVKVQEYNRLFPPQ